MIKMGRFLSVFVLVSSSNSLMSCHKGITSDQKGKLFSQASDKIQDYTNYIFVLVQLKTKPLLHSLSITNDGKKISQSALYTIQNEQQVFLTKLKKGVKVGIIDSGIDYTHKMLGGNGLIDSYKNINPALSANGLFPNKKVVDGYDFVGYDFRKKNKKGELIHETQFPHPDNNPIDEQGHGTHVAAIVRGTADNIHSYSGVAPDVHSYALKVFGRKGDTSISAIFAALEYAVDPNQDLDINDKLDEYIGNLFGRS